MVYSFNIPVETTNFSEIDDSLAHILRVRTDDRKQFFIWFIKFIFGVIEPETHTLRRSAELHKAPISLGVVMNWATTNLGCRELSLLLFVNELGDATPLPGNSYL